MPPDRSKGECVSRVDRPAVSLITACIDGVRERACGA